MPRKGRAGNGVQASQPVATRPLAIQLNGTWYTYGWDLTKNICELYGTNGYIATPEGRRVTAAERALHVQTQFDAAGNLLSRASAQGRLVCSATDNGDLQLDWFASDAAEDASPCRQETIRRHGNDTTHTRQQTGRDPHSIVRSEAAGVVIITRGQVCTMPLLTPDSRITPQCFHTLVETFKIRRAVFIQYKPNLPRSS